MAKIKLSFTIDVDRNKDIRRVNREAEVEQLRQGRKRPRATTIPSKKTYNRRRDNIVPLFGRDT